MSALVGITITCKFSRNNHTHEKSEIYNQENSSSLRIVLFVPCKALGSPLAYYIHAYNRHLSTLVHRMKVIAQVA